MVDDNADYLFTMETFLKRNGFEVATADDGRKGLELIRKEPPDVVLLDVMMESLFSGFEVCKQLRMDDNLKDIPIIGISGMGDEISYDLIQMRCTSKRVGSPLFQYPWATLAAEPTHRRQPPCHSNSAANHRTGPVFSNEIYWRLFGNV